MTDMRQVLLDARELISSPDRWCQGANAIDGAGISASPYSKRAAAWCSFGAIRKVTEVGDKETWAALLDYLNEIVERNSDNPLYADDDYQSLIVFNDNAETKHGDVIKIFDEAIDGMRNEGDSL